MGGIGIKNSMKKEQTKAFKVFVTISVIIFILISVIFTVVIWKYSYYIKNHPCEICIDKYGSSCILNNAIYYSEDGKLKVSRYLLNPIDNLPKNEEPQYIQKEELDILFAGLKNGIS